MADQGRKAVGSDKPDNGKKNVLRFSYDANG
jgi:hypothetical protein